MDRTISEASRTAHYAWRRRVAKHLPDLAGRVFALRGKHYVGCGVHYALEAELGYLIARMNDYSSTIDLSSTTVEPIRFAEFLRTLLRAEFSVRGWNFRKDEQVSRRTGLGHGDRRQGRSLGERLAAPL